LAAFVLVCIAIKVAKKKDLITMEFILGALKSHMKERVVKIAESKTINKPKEEWV